METSRIGVKVKRDRKQGGNEPSEERIGKGCEGGNREGRESWTEG